MFLVSEVDKGKERGKRPMPEVQKEISDRGDARVTSVELL